MRFKERVGDYLPPSAHCISTLDITLSKLGGKADGMKELNWSVGTFGPKEEN
jgi:hypothetical protein